MNTRFALLATAAAFALSAPVFADDKSTYKSEVKIEKDAKGNLEKKVSEEQKDVAGTVSSETKVNVEVEDDGDVEKTVTTKTVDDPKGLMNKTTTKTEDKVKQDDGKVTQEHTKTVNGKTVEKTKETR